MQSYYAQHSETFGVDDGTWRQPMFRVVCRHSAVSGERTCRWFEALKDSIDILQVQLYNSGSMCMAWMANVYTRHRRFYSRHDRSSHPWFSTSEIFRAPANHVAVALPACSLAAGGGYVSASSVISALNYLLGNGPQPGNYSLRNSSGYPALRGMMTWSINWDATSNCSSVYDFATTMKLYSDL